MSQSGYTPIQIYSSSTTGNTPSASNLTNSTLGSELAINITDGKLFYKDNSNTVQVIGWKTTPISAGGTGATTSTGALTNLGASPLAGSTSLTTLGTITTGTWNGSTIGVSYGGTGLTSLTAGYIPFGNGTSAFGNTSNLFWDNTNVRLGIGTSSPGYTLDVAGSIKSNANFAAIKVGSDSIGSGPYYTLDNGTSLSRAWATQLGASYTYDFWNFDGNSWSKRITFFLSGGVSIGNTTDPGAKNLSVSGNGIFSSDFFVGYSGMAYETGSNNAAIAGNLSIGNNNNSFQVNSTGINIISSGGGAAGAYSLGVGHPSGTAAGGAYMVYGYNGSVIGSITQVLTTGVAYNVTSDYRLKKNQQPLINSGTFIDSLKPTTWDWYDGNGSGAGFIAHEFSTVCPNYTIGTKDAVDKNGKPVYQSIDASNPEMIANIIAELQDLRCRLKKANIA